MSEVRHDLAGEASEALAAPGATAVDEDVTGADRAQGMELLHNLFGTAVHGATYVDGARITGGPVRPAMDRAVGPRCQTQLTYAVLQTAFSAASFSSRPSATTRRATFPLAWVRSGVRSRLPDILRGGILPEQQIVAFRGHLTD
jgi:hypothetical protein